MTTATEYWFDLFGEYPKSDNDKLAVAFAQEYVQNVIKAELLTCQKCESNQNGLPGVQALLED
jgi:hypothetical protein